MQSKGFLAIILWTFVIVSASAVMVGVMELDWVKGVILFFVFLSAISASSPSRSVSVSPRHPHGPPERTDPDIPAPPSGKDKK